MTCIYLDILFCGILLYLLLLFDRIVCCCLIELFERENENGSSFMEAPGAPFFDLLVFVICFVICNRLFIFSSCVEALTAGMLTAYSSLENML